MDEARIDSEKLIELRRLMSTPIDFDLLIRDGVLVKEGSWYRVKDMDALPEHAKQKVKEIASDASGVKVRFYANKQTGRFRR